MAKKSKNTLISEEIARLEDIFQNIQKDKRDLCKDLIQNAAFMAVSLRELQQQIEVDGWVETYQNGATQTGRKVGSAAQMYNKLVQNYNTVIKQLVILLPNEEKTSAMVLTDPMSGFLDE